jgi:hypothetical protein
MVAWARQATGESHGIRHDEVSGGLAASHGFEPWQNDSESLVLPLHHEAMTDWMIWEQLVTVKQRDVNYLTEWKLLFRVALGTRRWRPEACHAVRRCT